MSPQTMDTTMNKTRQVAARCALPTRQLRRQSLIGRRIRSQARALFYRRRPYGLRSPSTLRQVLATHTHTRTAYLNRWDARAVRCGAILEASYRRPTKVGPKVECFIACARAQLQRFDLARARVERPRGQRTLKNDRLSIVFFRARTHTLSSRRRRSPVRDADN